jgi:hypothetical protein
VRFRWVAGMADDPRERLAAARLYLCTDARQEQGDLAEFLDAVLGAGVDIVQLRQKGLEAAQELACLEVFRRARARHGAARGQRQGRRRQGKGIIEPWVIPAGRTGDPPMTLPA